MARDAEGFDHTVRRPPGLTIGHIRNAVEHIAEAWSLDPVPQLC